MPVPSLSRLRTSPVAIDIRGAVADLSDGRHAGGRALRHRSDRPARRVRLLHRPFRLRQDDADADHRRSGSTDRRPHHGQRREPGSGAPQARLRLRVPGARAVCLAQRAAQRHAAARDHGHVRGRAQSARREIPGDGRVWPASSASFPGSSRAACSSACRSPARSPSSRICC